MDNYSIKACAKVNLALDVLGRDASGYHQIQTVLHEVESLYDEISFEMSNDRLEFLCSNPLLIFDESNTIVKAVALFEECFGKKVTGKFSVIKNIPLNAGLGGGSSDAAAVLRLLKRVYKVMCCDVDYVDGWHDSDCPLQRLCRKIGMDVLFFLEGGTQYATHFGEQLQILPSASRFFNFEMLPDVPKLSTKHVYENLDLTQCGKNIAFTQQFLKALENADSQKMFEALHNDFDQNPITTPREKIMLAGSGGSKVRISMLK